MILVDTSVWVDHLAHSDASLERLLKEGRALVHPFTIGEIALGNLRGRKPVLEMLDALPQVMVAMEEEVIRAVETRRLFGAGIGYIDAHLIVSCLLSGVTLWSRDKRLAREANRLGIASALPATRH